ncbi:kirola-like [Cucumis melo var. makuwa]|uniref:Kirola-like n=1 Tax=Cucumis melo var. makuwa TaxID=1194695 RepID=A0A5A7U0S5_CUCMM|nr:kirola-like [Cucumis melo var. makuwa]TYK20760.1 kirola-like [Cucumis melo var. makuwa]
MPKNSFPSNMQSSAPPTTPHAPPSEIHASVLPPQTASTNPSVQPFSSSATNIAPHAPICVLPPKSGRQPPLLPSNLYALPPIDLSHHPNVKNTKIHSTFEIGESLAHSNPNVQVSSGIAQQQLEGLRKQIAALEATLRTTSNTSIPMYSENPVISFPTLSSPYVTNTVALSTAYHFSGDKLNDNNYFSWSQSVKMVLEGRHKFGFLIGEIPCSPPDDPQERY